MRKLYKYKEDFHRMGNLDGVFMAEESDVNEMLGHDIYLGEVLGKHSEITATADHDTVKVLSDNQDVINVLYDIFPNGHIAGTDLLGSFRDRREDGAYDDEELGDE